MSFARYLYETDGQLHDTLPRCTKVSGGSVITIPDYLASFSLAELQEIHRTAQQLQVEIPEMYPGGSSWTLIPGQYCDPIKLRAHLRRHGHPIVVRNVPTYQLNSFDQVLKFRELIQVFERAKAPECFMSLLTAKWDSQAQQIWSSHRNESAYPALPIQVS